MTLAVPFVPGIPRTVHRICFGGVVPEGFRDSLDAFARENHEFRHVIWDDLSATNFVRTHYGRRFAKLFSLINPDYAAVRADLFRYALIYKVGGIYLDLKSTTSRPLREIILPDDCFLLSHWDNKEGQPHSGWGLHTELRAVPGGEFQQWHVIASQGHPFLKAAVQAVTAELRKYRPWRNGTGRPGALRTSGPVVYTKAIYPLLERYPHRMLEPGDRSGLVYSIFGSGNIRHTSLFARNYHQSEQYILPPSGPLQARWWGARMRYEQSHSVWWWREHQRRALTRLGIPVPERVGRFS